MNDKSELKILKAFFNNHRSKYLPYLIYTFIVGAYIFFCKIPRLKEKTNKNMDTNTKVIPTNKINSILSEVELIYKNDEKFNLILISSYADGKYTESSDIDMIVILNDLTFENFFKFIVVKIKLDRLGVFYQKIDPTQHHGNWIFHEKEFFDYNEIIMPMCVLDNAISIQRESKIFFKENRVDFKKEIKKMFLIHIDNGRKLCNKMFENKINLYELKDFISIISLLVPMLFQIQGQMLRKEEAINKKEIVLDKKSIEILDFSTKTRENWRFFNKKGLYMIIRCLSFICFERTILNYISKKYKIKYRVEEIKKITKTDFLKKEDFMYYFDFIERKINEVNC